MTELFKFPSAERPSLPEPRRERWQPLRIGLVELFHYDSEEFWFHDGHLLLRGNNGTGKSKVLSLTLPFLFDAQLRSSRIEPDGDNSKRMSWNLLMNEYPRRIGYTWLELGRHNADGTSRYLTLGAGLSAVDGRSQVDSWFFLLEGAPGTQGPRINHDLWLTNDQRVVLTRERLRETIDSRGWGQVFENAHGYRRAVDERLFQLGARRYEALMDTLIKLRQPQLSKKPDEAGLSTALSEALPPLPSELLTDVAEALNQLEEDRRQLDETRQLEHAVQQFEQRYRTYAGMVTRRQARELRQAQTGFDNASEERNRTHAALETARHTEANAIVAHETAKRSLAAARERLGTLQSDPANQEANRLGQARQDADERKREAESALTLLKDAQEKLAREEDRSRHSSRRVEAARSGLDSARTQFAARAQTAGTAASLTNNPLTALPAEELTTLAEAKLTAASNELHVAAAKRRQDIRQLEQRHATVEKTQSSFQSLQSVRQRCQTELEAASDHRAEADRNAERAGTALIDAWSTHCASLKELRFDTDDPLQQLAAWTARPEGANPVLAALTDAYRAASVRHADRQSELSLQQTNVDQQRTALSEERDRLTAGHDVVPLPPPTRAPGVREHRPGAPLWRLVDFQSHVKPAQRAALEAALEASGLLDAWLSPDGELTGTTGAPLLDTLWARRPASHSESLADVLIPAVPDGNAITAEGVMAVLANVAYGREVETAESWISADGRYRLGSLGGAWHKPEAIYIGHTARAQARQRRLQEIAAALDALNVQQTLLNTQFTALSAARRQSEEEWRGAPTDTALREAILAAVSAEQAVSKARERLDQTDDQCLAAEAQLNAAREALKADALDLALPVELSGLTSIAEAVDQLIQAQSQLLTAARDWRNAWPEHILQEEREREAHENLARHAQASKNASERADKALARYQVLHGSIGLKVEKLRRQLSAASEEARTAEQNIEGSQRAQQEAGERRAIASTEATAAEAHLTERIAARVQATERLQRFAHSGLLSSALPDLELPEEADAWTIDPALTLARRAEQSLTHIKDDEASWTRVQHQIAEDLTELHRSLSALGHQATSEPNDWGFTVHILYRNRPERPDTLAALLADDIAQRSELLSAKEREVLENHLQAEIAAEIQRLMRAADRQVVAINEELQKRPTTTGMRYRLQWQPLTAEEGAPAGLEIARERLLNISSDLWSPEDRRAVGSMLQQQISMERARADADPTAPSGTLIEQLARALDYRHWHRFQVQRHQAGRWSRLSGPASSGERALGLTIPLFAAISSFYGRGASPHAPRLMLLDEAFAGIDDVARSDCMGLIREFDLDFLITSEREWACYATLPGVSICQLQRREGVDAVFVSRWIWDGRAKRREEDPDRRFPAA